jgi:hypothetical protein
MYYYSTIYRFVQMPTRPRMIIVILSHKLENACIRYTRLHGERYIVGTSARGSEWLTNGGYWHVISRAFEYTVCASVSIEIGVICLMLAEDEMLCSRGVTCTMTLEREFGS